MVKRSTFFLVILLVFISFGAMKALMHEGFYTSHDGWHQVARLYHFDQALQDGQFPPRWSGMLLNGFGYPLFIFSYHLPWWLAEPWLIMHLSIFDAIKAVFITTYILSGLSMFFLTKSMWGEKAAFLSAFLYLFTPYRFATILVRANIGEAVSFAFFPLIFLGIYKLSQKFSTQYIVVSALGIAGVLLSHVMVVQLFFLLGVSFFIYLLFFAKFKRHFMFSSLISVFLGVGLSSYYLMPAYIYKSQTVFSNLYHHLYLNHFTSLSKLFYSPWGYAAIGLQVEMSRQIGLVIWGLAGISLFYFISHFCIKRNKRISKHMVFLMLLIGVFVFSVFLMTESSKFIWHFLEPVTLIDFPWRFLSVTTFIGSLVVGQIVYLIQNKQLQYVFIFIVSILLLYTNRNHLRVNQYTDIPLSLYIESERTTNTDDEYLPKWVNREQVQEKQALATSEATINSVLQTTNTITFSATTDTPKNVKIHHMYFPGWKAYLNSQEVPLQKGLYGGMELVIPSGMYNSTLQFEPTLPMRIGEVVTIISLLSIIGMLFYSRGRFI